MQEADDAANTICPRVSSSFGMVVICQSLPEFGCLYTYDLPVEGLMVLAYFSVMVLARCHVVDFSPAPDSSSTCTITVSVGCSRKKSVQ